ncbi:Os06g0117600 [Oryza sativa Japonica Group]|uniref:Os06g0117600 protein n=1 Tax=Oryza sativa subsp. japonica TaxID=39947 RepID=A0A0P0WSC4_ORYSJ|nr:Os06g0117600 [Oryza sativa Japonica Group]
MRAAASDAARVGGGWRGGDSADNTLPLPLPSCPRRRWPRAGGLGDARRRAAPPALLLRLSTLLPTSDPQCCTDEQREMAKMKGENTGRAVAGPQLSVTAVRELGCVAAAAQRGVIVVLIVASALSIINRVQSMSTS